MRISFRAVIGAAITAGLVALRASAQDTPPVAAPAAPTNAVPGPATNAAAPKTDAKKTTAKPAPKPVAMTAEQKPEPVFNPEPGVAKQNNINVRGQASINSEVIGHLQKNDPITILELVTLKKPKQDEPAHWFRIALPPQIGVWVHSIYVDTTTSTVKPRRLNLRGGPGENYSIVGRLEKGATVKTVETKNGWLKIETPTNAFGFVAAHLAERTPQAIVAVLPKTNEIVSVPPPVTTVQNAPPPVVAEVTPANPVVAPPTTATPPAITPAPTVAPAPAESLPEAPIEKVRKIVSREGILKGSVSIQAPSYFSLRSLDTGKTIDYVFSPSTNLLLKEFKGQRIIVTGEELLDERWPNTPVIIVDSLQTVP